jgi:hypothetical protein
MKRLIETRPLRSISIDTMREAAAVGYNKCMNKAVNAIREGLVKGSLTGDQAYSKIFENTGFDPKSIVVMDSAIMPPTSATMPASNLIPIQYLQHSQTGFVDFISQVRMADEAFGQVIYGDWFMEQVITKYISGSGAPGLYSNSDNVPIVGISDEFQISDVVIAELGVSFDTVAISRAALIDLELEFWGQKYVINFLEDLRNRMAFRGFDVQNSRTYGILNHPSLLPYNTFPIGASGSTEWSQKTYLEITGDIRLMDGQMRTQSGYHADAGKYNTTMLLSGSAYSALTTSTDYGETVWTFLDKNYKNVNVLAVPEMEDAVGGENAAYWYLNKEPAVASSSTDDGAILQQLILAKSLLLGSKQELKRNEKVIISSYAGLNVKRPVFITRFAGN